MKINIFTDGACSKNPGPGGYGILMRAEETGLVKTFSKGFTLTTNNRMELLAVIVSLENLKSSGHEIHIHTDSRYVADAINKGWLQNWQKRGFKNVKNPDLWKRLLPLLQLHSPTFHWIKGHSGHIENERCDALAVIAYKNGPLEIDEGFENPDATTLF